MKKPLLVSLILVLTCLSGISQSSKFDFSYAIFLGNGFDNDTVSIRVNNVNVTSKYVLTSSKMVNMVMNFRVRQTAKGIVIFYNGKERLKPKIKHEEYIDVELIVNGLSTKQKVNLKNGQILLFNLDSSSGFSLQKRKVTLEQRKEAIIVI